MKNLDKKSFVEIKTWMYRNARPLELALWKYEFENGSKEDVVSILSYYQNEDGGFGNALEPDNWNPNSTPYTTLNAINKLIEINFTDKNHPIFKGIFKFLDSGIHSNENSWKFNIPTNDNYPHAPWWNYNEETNEYESIGVSAGLASFLLKFTDQESKLYKKAYSKAIQLMEKLYTPDNLGDMGIDGYITLKKTILQLGLSEHFDMDFISQTLTKLVKDSIERDVSKWESYVNKPSNFITSPDSEYYRENEEIMQKELDYMIETRPENGVWGITWSWFEHNDKYPKEFAISENWWKADIVIKKLRLLRSFGRIE
jgi:hypothetical protein